MTPPNTAEIHKFDTDHKPSLEPVQVTVRYVLPDGRDISATTVYTPGQTNTLTLDAVMADMDRVRAKCEIPELEDKITQGKDLMREATEAFERVKKDTDAKIEDLKEQGIAQLGKVERKVNELSSKVSEGRRFDENSPGNKRELEPLKRGVEEIAQEIEKVEAEMKAETRNFEATKIKHAEDIRKFEDRLAQRKKLVTP